jgi:hypothetical protein
MRSIRHSAISILMGAMGLFMQAHPIFAQAPSHANATNAQPLRDGQHDFDFHFGTWRAHIKRLVHPLSGSTTWVELDGTVTTRKIWDGRANLEEIEAGNATAHFKGLTLFLYNPESHQWSQNFADIDDGALSQNPLMGKFKDGRGELFDQETFNGRTILVRFVWSDITPNSHHVEQSFSDDGGKTWEPNFVAALTRLKDGRLLRPLEFDPGRPGLMTPD